MHSTKLQPAVHLKWTAGCNLVLNTFVPKLVVFVTVALNLIIVNDQSKHKMRSEWNLKISNETKKGSGAYQFLDEQNYGH